MLNNIDLSNGKTRDKVLTIYRPEETAEIRFKTGYVVAVINDNHDITIVKELSDLDDEFFDLYQQAFNEKRVYNLIHEVIVLDRISFGKLINPTNIMSMTSTVYKRKKCCQYIMVTPDIKKSDNFYIPALFTNDEQTLNHLINAGARTEEMTRIQKNLVDGESFNSCDKKGFFGLLLMSPNGIERFETQTSEVSFYGWVNRVFVENTLKRLSIDK